MDNYSMSDAINKWVPGYLIITGLSVTAENITIRTAAGTVSTYTVDNIKELCPSTRRIKSEGEVPVELEEAFALVKYIQRKRYGDYLKGCMPISWTDLRVPPSTLQLALTTPYAVGASAWLRIMKGIARKQGRC